MLREADESDLAANDGTGEEEMGLVFSSLDS